jgi:hypothetical protein
LHPDASAVGHPLNLSNQNSISIHYIDTTLLLLVLLKWMRLLLLLSDGGHVYDYDHVTVVIRHNTSN